MATESDMLHVLLSDDRISDEERTAFQDMEDKLSSNKPLSKKQRQWVESKWRELEHDAGESLNLMSSGSVPRGKEVKMLFDISKRPLSPPNRRPSNG